MITAISILQNLLLLFTIVACLMLWQQKERNNWLRVKNSSKRISISIEILVCQKKTLFTSNVSFFLFALLQESGVFFKRQEIRIKNSFKFLGLEKMSLGEMTSQDIFDQQQSLF